VPEPSVFDVLCDAIRRGVDHPDLTISRDMAAADVPGWDSLAHTRIILTAEVALGVRVDMHATYGAATVGDLEQLLLASPRTK
jgi:acyl carrier protein